jgi:hypothetical protein
VDSAPTPAVVFARAVRFGPSCRRRALAGRPFRLDVAVARALAALALAVATGACGTPPLAEVAADAGTADAGPTPDAGHPPDAGLGADAGPMPGPAPSLAPVLPNGPRRGPIALGFTASGGDVTDFRLDRIEGGAAVPASAYTVSFELRAATVVWSSFEDAPYDGRVELVFVASFGDRRVEAPFSVDVRNDPAADRLVVVSHPLADRAGGGATPTNTEASVFRWNGLEPGVVGERRTVVVGAGPARVRAAPHGRATAVVGDSDGTITILATPLDAAAERATATAELSLPHGWPADLRWSRDGRHLYVAGGLASAPPLPPTLWRFTPTEDLSDFGAPQALAVLPGPPSALDVDGDGRVIVACGSGGAGQAKVALFGPDGAEGGVVFGDFGPADALAFTPRGTDALFISSGFAGPQLARFSAGPAGLALVGPLVTTLPSPGDVLFHPASDPLRPVALVSQWEKNSVTPVTLTATGLALEATQRNVPLAGDMDLIERGPQAGTVLVSAVSRLVRIEFQASGQAIVRGPAIDFGTGTRNITQGVAIQR